MFIIVVCVMCSLLFMCSLFFFIVFVFIIVHVFFIVYVYFHYCFLCVMCSFSLDVLSAKLDGHGTGLFSLVTKNEQYNCDSSNNTMTRSGSGGGGGGGIYPESPPSEQRDKNMLRKFSARKKTWVLKCLDPLDMLHDWLNVLVQCKNHKAASSR